VRLPGGEFIEVHQQLDEYERWKLVSYNDYKPLMIRPGVDGKISNLQKVRASVSRWFFEDRIEPVSQTELEHSHGHGQSAVTGTADQKQAVGVGSSSSH
jgi:ubiquinol-cytochrome c reductase cytochrome b subunit